MTPKHASFARKYPLTLHFVANDDTEFCIPDVFERYKSRIRSLTLSGDSDIVQKLLQRMDRFPIAETFAITGDMHDIPNIPDALFQGAPHLRDVRLRGVNFDIRRLSTLTHLDLSYSPSYYPSIASAGFSFSEMLSMLERCPLLQTLRLDKCLDSSSSSAIDSRPKVRLLHLCTLELVDSSEYVLAFMKSIEICPTTSINLVPHGISCGRDISPMLVIMSKHLRCRHAPVLRSISIEGSMNAYISITAGASQWIGPRSRVHHHFSIRTHPRTHKGAREIISKTLDALPLANITNLEATTLTRSNVFTAGIWRLIFSRLPAITTIKMGVNQGMLTMMTGFLDVMVRGPTGLTEKRRRRAKRCPNESPSGLSNLVLVKEIDEEDRDIIYESLSRKLLEFQELDRPYKAAHVPFHMVCVEAGDEEIYGHTLRHEQLEMKRLFDIVEVLNIEGKQYEPVEELISSAEC